MRDTTAPRDALDGCSATALAGRIRRRELSSSEALEAQLARIEGHGAALNAVVSLDADAARRAARAADDALASGAEPGPLHGVAVTLKDGHEVAGLRTTIGAPLFDRTALEDGAVAARLRAAGAIIMGHTNVPPFLGDYQSANEIFGRTNNPWRLDRTPGGSSGGAAAAVAGGLTPFEVGSDLAGSVRQPSHCCGTYGLKTTEHRVPMTGFFRPPGGGPRPFRIMTVLGPIARSLDDLDLVSNVIAGPDGLDGDVPPVPLERNAVPDVAGLRIAVPPAPPGLPLARSVRDAVANVAGRASNAGAHVTDAAPPLDWNDCSALFGELVDALSNAFDPRAAQKRDLPWYLNALARRDAFGSAVDAFFASVDVLVLPGGIAPAFPHGEPGAPLDVDGERVDYWSQAWPYVAFNLTGHPALAVPAGVHDGLPVGVQLVGPRWSESKLIAIARALEGAGVLPGFNAPDERALASGT